MKKRLLITSALMTAVLGASLATGTYAWYQVSNNSTPTATAVSGSVGTLAPSVTIDALTFTISLSGTDVTENEGVYTLASVDLTNASGATKYYVNDDTIPTYVATKKYGSFTVSVALSLSNPEDLANYEGTYTFVVDGGGYVRVNDTADTYADEEVTFTVEIDSEGNVTNEGKTVYYTVAPKSETAAETEEDHEEDKVTISLQA